VPDIGAVMSAQIIQFGKPRTDVTRQEAEQAQAQLPTPVVRETVRFMLNDDLYEVERRGGEVWRLSKIQYRITVRGVQEMKRHCWYGSYRSPADLDPVIVEAARRAQVNGRNVDDGAFRRVAVAQLQKRRAKLVRELEQVDATIASMQPGLN
jgi:hypothetical protein